MTGLRLMLCVGAWLASATGADAGTYLGQYSANPAAPKSTANPAQRFDPNSVTNPYGRYGSPFSPQSATNPYALDAPRLYDSQGRYRGKLSDNRFDADSIANRHGRYGNPASPDYAGPAGRAAPFDLDSPVHPHGRGLRIIGKD